MAYDFIGLVNDLCETRFNEVPLTSSNFSSAGGFYTAAKSGVNAALREINHGVFNWPWNHEEVDLTLVAGQSRYSFPADAKSVDFDTFRIRQDDTLGNETVFLRKIDYDQYVRDLIRVEYETDTGSQDVPRCVFTTQNRQLGVYPPPDQAYTLTYEYFKNPPELSTATDVPTLPEQFRHLIIDGASIYGYLFRSDYESADRIRTTFNENLKDLRSIYVNTKDHIWDTRVPQRGGGGSDIVGES